MYYSSCSFTGDLNLASLEYNNVEAYTTTQLSLKTGALTCHGNANRTVTNFSSNIFCTISSPCFIVGYFASEACAPSDEVLQIIHLNNTYLTLQDEYSDDQVVLMTVLMNAQYDRTTQFNSTNCLTENIQSHWNVNFWALGDEAGGTILTLTNYTSDNNKAGINGGVSIFNSNVYMNGFYLMNSDVGLPRLMEFNL